jgi:hypothetical protein
MPGCHDGAPNTRIWTASTLIGIEPTSAQNGGSARAYFVGLSRRQRSTVMGRPRHDGGRARISIRAMLYRTLAHAAGGHFADARVWRLPGAADVAEVCGMVTLRSL